MGDTDGVLTKKQVSVNRKFVESWVNLIGISHTNLFCCD